MRRSRFAKPLYPIVQQLLPLFMTWRQISSWKILLGLGWAGPGLEVFKISMRAGPGLMEARGETTLTGRMASLTMAEVLRIIWGSIGAGKDWQALIRRLVFGMTTILRLHLQDKEPSASATLPQLRTLI